MMNSNKENTFKVGDYVIVNRMGGEKGVIVSQGKIFSTVFMVKLSGDITECIHYTKLSYLEPEILDE